MTSTVSRSLPVIRSTVSVAFCWSWSRTVPSGLISFTAFRSSSGHWSSGRIFPSSPSAMPMSARARSPVSATASSPDISSRLNRAARMRRTVDATLLFRNSRCPCTAATASLEQPG